MRISSRHFALPMSFLALGALTACGADGLNDVSAAAADKANLSEEGKAALAQVKLVEEGPEDAANNNLECLTLRTKIKAERETLKLGGDWGNLEKTQAGQSLATHCQQYKDGKCNPTAENDACKTLEQNMVDDADALRQTPEWAVVQKNDQWKSLWDNYNKAKTIGCFK